LVAIVALIIIGIISSNDFTNKTKNNSIDFEWSNIVLCNIIPEPDSTFGEIYYNDSQKLSFDLCDISYSDFQNYANVCKSKGFNIEVSFLTNKFEAYNQERFHISIYYDEDNNYLYTFNNDKKDKYALKLEDNKFFKNILFLNAAYKKVTSSKGGSLTENGVLSPITGIQFDADQASVFDKVLEIEQINVRSLHKQVLEPTLFSSYCNLTGELKGFAPNGQLAMGYTFDTEPKLTSNKLKF
jgi:hypothetical protein